MTYTSSSCRQTKICRSFSPISVVGQWSGCPHTQKPAAFDSLGLTDALIAVVAGLGYEEATLVQRQAIPLMLEGKTCSLKQGLVLARRRRSRCLLFKFFRGKGAKGKGERVRRPAPWSWCPPASSPCRWPRLSTSTRAGRTPRRAALTAAPRCSSRFGRFNAAPTSSSAPRDAILDHIRRTTLLLDAIRVVVLDEADEMLDMGFADDI
jgi:ATP-dependent RNA helicase DeaD